MKPVDYTKTSRYGETMAAGRAAKVMSGSPLRNRGPVELETAFYQEGMNHALRLGELGLQRDMFEGKLAEDKRQFNAGMTEKKRQFSMNMDLSQDRFKYMRRQNQKAEILGMVNIGIGLGMGYLQYKANRRQLEMNKMMLAIMKGRNG